MAKKAGHVGPYSRIFVRGVIGNSVDGRTEIGRYMRHMEFQLIQHCGGDDQLTFPQRLVITNIVRMGARLFLLDRKLSEGRGTDLDLRTYLGMLTSFRKATQSLGLKEPEKPQMNAIEYAKLKRTRRVAV
jgi:hypothetical protein